MALLAYAAWPTWARTLVPDRLAALVEADGRYGRSVLAAWADPAEADPAALQRDRLDARLARSNAEAVVDRWLPEPTGHDFDPEVARGVLAAVRPTCKPCWPYTSIFLRAAPSGGVSPPWPTRWARPREPWPRHCATAPQTRPFLRCGPHNLPWPVSSGQPQHRLGPMQLASKARLCSTTRRSCWSVRPISWSTPWIPSHTSSACDQPHRQCHRVVRLALAFERPHWLR